MDTKFTKTRPVISIPLTNVDVFLEVLGWIVLIMLWALTIYSYQQLPDIIPAHFNLKGQVDNYEHKFIVLLLPLLPTILFVILTVLNRYPYILNYPVPITPNNAFRQYSLAARMLRYIRLAILIIFIMILLVIVQTAENQATKLGGWLFPIAMLLTFVPVMTYLILASQKKNSVG